MEENRQNMDNPASTNPAELPPQNTESQPKPLSRKAKIIIALCAVVALLLIVGPALLGSNNKKSDTASSSLFYDMVEKTSQQDKVRLTRHSLKYDSLADRANNKPSTDATSLSEFDYKTRKYSTVFLYTNRFTSGAGRCVESQPYQLSIRDYNVDTRADAEAVLKQPATPESDPEKFVVNPCDIKRPGRYGEFLDGILPIGLSPGQASEMIQDIKRRNYVAVKDEGVSEYKGKKGKKISIHIGKEANGSEHKADAFYYSFRDGTSGKVAGNGIDLAKVHEQFNSNFDIRPAGGLKGFYIIDEQTKLPIYSEIETTADGLSEFTPQATKQHYEYPSMFKIKPDTPLEVL